MADIGTSFVRFTSMPSPMNARPRLVRLAVVAHAALLQDGRDLVVVVLREHVRERPAEVPQEAIAGRSALHDASGERGQPRARVVATRVFVNSAIMSSVQFCAPASQLSLIRNRRPRVPISGPTALCVVVEVCVHVRLRTCSGFSLSTSSPVPSGEAGWLFMPSSE